MITALITGKLSAAPQLRTSTAGRAYALARVAVPQDGEATLFVSVFAFAQETCAVLMALGAGAEVSISGTIKVGTWTDRNGQAQAQVTITAAAVLTLHERRAVDRAVGKARQQARDRHTHHEPDQRHGDGLDDGRPLDF